MESGHQEARPIMKLLRILLFCVAAPLLAGDVQEINLNSGQLRGLLKATEMMHKYGFSLQGKQVVIDDEGTNYSVSFMNDPLNPRILGNQGGISWRISKDGKRVDGPTFSR